ncbi:EF-hand domain-containing protein [Devosia sp. CAU 1758]
MTDSAIGSGPFGPDLLARLFQRADADRNNVVSAEEIAGLLPGSADPDVARGVVSRHDQDNDDQLSLAEFSVVTMAPATMASLLSVQEYKAASRDERMADDRAAVDALFERADLDGDGLLSREEFDAERALQFAQALDEGDIPQHGFAALPGAAEDGYFSRDEVMIGRRMIDVLDPIDLDDPDLDPTVRERVEAVRRLTPIKDGAAEPPPAPPPDIETVLGGVVRSAELTDALMARLIRQLELGAVRSDAAEVQQA